MFHVLWQVAAVLQCKFHLGYAVSFRMSEWRQHFRYHGRQYSYIFKTSSSGHALNIKLKSDCNLIFLQISLLLLFLKVFSLSWYCTSEIRCDTSTASCMWPVLWRYKQKFVIKIKIVRRKKWGKNSSKQHILQSVWAIPAPFPLINESFGYFCWTFMNLYCKFWIYTNTDWMWHICICNHTTPPLVLSQSGELPFSSWYL